MLPPSMKKPKAGKGGAKLVAREDAAPTKDDKAAKGVDGKTAKGNKPVKGMDGKASKGKGKGEQLDLLANEKPATKKRAKSASAA